MASGLVELLGIFLVVIGACALLGAAALVSVPLATLADGVFLVLFGMLVVYAANASARAPRPPGLS